MLESLWFAGCSLFDDVFFRCSPPGLAELILRHMGHEGIGCTAIPPQTKRWLSSAQLGQGGTSRVFFFSSARPGASDECALRLSVAGTQVQELLTPPFTVALGVRSLGRKTPPPGLETPGNTRSNGSPRHETENKYGNAPWRTGSSDELGVG